MSKTIWKYQLDGSSIQLIDMPRGAKVLTVQMQDGAPVLWALVDPAQPPEVHTIAVYDTGNPVSSEIGQYVGTFQDGWYVGHVFDWTATQ